MGRGGYPDEETKCLLVLAPAFRRYSQAYSTENAARNAERFGFADRGASSLVARVDTFTTLVKCIARVVEDCGGSLEEEKHLGAYVMDAVNAVTVCPL